MLGACIADQFHREMLGGPSKRWNSSIEAWTKPVNSNAFIHPHSLSNFDFWRGLASRGCKLDAMAITKATINITNLRTSEHAAACVPDYTHIFSIRFAEAMQERLLALTCIELCEDLLEFYMRVVSLTRKMYILSYPSDANAMCQSLSEDTNEVVDSVLLVLRDTF